MEKVLKPWTEVKDDPPGEVCTFTTWPYRSLWLNRFVITNDVMADFAQRYLQAENIQLRTLAPFVRYPGCDSFTETTHGRDSIHVDNINNSRLPECDDHIFGQVQFWSDLQDVGPEQAPLLLWPNSDRIRLHPSRQLMASAIIGAGSSAGPTTTGKASSTIRTRPWIFIFQSWFLHSLPNSGECK